MPGMKRDMAGAAAILGSFVALVETNSPYEVHAILCLAENSVGPMSTRPDDIHYMYSHRTVEVNNTDAEGRLVLADGVAYASEHIKPDIILDMATLTGAQGVATGRSHAAVVSNDEDLELATVIAGKNCGDLVHPLLFVPEFFKKEFNSVVADMKNSVADRSNAPCSAAGIFIWSHLNPSWKGSWVHIDMAYPAYSGERATGYGVGLIMSLFK